MGYWSMTQHQKFGKQYHWSKLLIFFETYIYNPFFIIFKIVKKNLKNLIFFLLFSLLNLPVQQFATLKKNINLNEWSWLANQGQS
jgi:hypothetical protein